MSNTDLLLLGSPAVIDGAALQAWLTSTFPVFQEGHWSLVPRPHQHCRGESRYMAMVEDACHDAPDITADPASLAAKDIAEHQRGDYHHLYVDHAVAFAVACGVLASDYVVVYHCW